MYSYGLRVTGDSKVDKLNLPGSANSFVTPSSLPGLLTPMLMPHLTSLTQEPAPPASASPASTASSLASQVPLLSPPPPPPISIPAAVTSSSQHHQALSQRPVTSHTSLNLIPPPSSTSTASSTSVCTNLTTLTPSEDKESKREHRRRDNLTRLSARNSSIFDTLLSSYHEQQQQHPHIGRSRNSMHNLFPFNFSTYSPVFANSKQHHPQHPHHHQQQQQQQQQQHTFRSPMDVVLRCSTPNCSCDCFAPGKPLMRVCAHCNHGWIAHAMEKLNLDKLFTAPKYGSSTLSSQNIPGFPTGNTLFDIASLMLFGTHALPVRLKILLDRLLCALEHDELVNLLHAFGWTYEDYSRGYMLQDSIGNILTKWIIVSKEEEIYMIQLFLKFPETKTIAQNFVLSESVFNQYSETSAIMANKFKDYELKKLVDCTNSTLLPKNSLLNLNSNKAPIGELNTHNSKNQFENNKSNKSAHHDIKEMENKSNRASKQCSDEGDKTSSHKHSIKSSPSVNHLSQSKSEKSMKKSPVPNHNSITSPFISLSKLDSLVSPFEYRKKESKNSLINDVSGEANQFLSPNVSASSASPVTNPLFSLANFNPLLNPALLSDPSKYPNASDYCKLDLTNPATAAAAAAAAAALNKNLDFSSFNTDESSKATNLNSTKNSQSSDAINLTQGKSSHNHNHNLDRKMSKHLRKSSNPIKRRWDPLILSSLTTNPATGKKRVQCNVCLKTFCDKGALKIHFSAVHLREMHKCTVEGCNMMFSSRRSRNRHSANPNPKLHTPNFRRKINPHDGRTANPYPPIAPSSGPLFGIAGVNGAIIPNYDPLKDNYSDHSPKADYSIDFNSMSSHSSRGSPNDEMLDDAYSDDNNTSKDPDEDGDLNGDDNDDICIDLTVKDDTHKSPRKRKNFNPIKFSMNNNNDNESYQFMSTDDEDDDGSSSDTEYNSMAKKVRVESDLDSDDNEKVQPVEENDIDTDVDIDDDSQPNHNQQIDTGDKDQDYNNSDEEQEVSQ